MTQLLVRPWMEFQPPNFEMAQAWLRPGSCKHSTNEAENRSSIAYTVSFSLSSLGFQSYRYFKIRDEEMSTHEAVWVRGHGIRNSVGIMLEDSFIAIPIASKK